MYTGASKVLQNWRRYDSHTMRIHNYLGSVVMIPSCLCRHGQRKCRFRRLRQISTKRLGSSLKNREHERHAHARNHRTMTRNHWKKQSSNAFTYLSVVYAFKFALNG